LLLLLDARFQADRMYATTPLSYAVCYISAGYFLHDLVMCTIRFSLEGPLYLTHALVCHMAYTFGAATGFLHYHGAAFLMWEISTPFVHARWFMYKAGLANSKLYVLNGLAMLSAFFGCRIVWGYVGSYRLVTDVLRERFIEGSLFPLGGTVGYCLIAAIMNTLNTYWFYKMVVAAVHVLIKGKKGAEVGSHKDE
ncbi:putative TLC domain-containing protein C17A2.02c, partial [Tetrabaena socialis]